MARRFNDFAGDIEHNKNLIQSIFERAFQDLFGKNLDLRHESMQWVFGETDGGFEFYCRLMDINAYELRFKLKEKMQNG